LNYFATACRRNSRAPSLPSSGRADPSALKITGNGPTQIVMQRA
jgi:hypothetical protein